MYFATMPYELQITSSVPLRTFRFLGTMDELVDLLDECYEKVVEKGRFAEK